MNNKERIAELEAQLAEAAGAFKNWHLTATTAWETNRTLEKQLAAAEARAEAAEKVAEAAVAYMTTEGETDKLISALYDAVNEYRAALRPDDQPAARELHTHFCQHCADRWECNDAACKRGEVFGCLKSEHPPESEGE